MDLLLFKNIEEWNNLVSYVCSSSMLSYFIFILSKWNFALLFFRDLENIHIRTEYNKNN